MKQIAPASPTPGVTHGRMYWHKPVVMRVVALNDPGGKKNLGSHCIPCLKLRGMWMTAVGFDVDSRITVELSPGCITLRLIESPTPIAA